ncbi:MAG: glycosyltransferase, partial [Alphaproteobacteria bacterium]
IKSAEALAAGLPLVATPAGALGVEGATGSGMIVATDAEGMAAAIRALAADPARRATMADAAHAFARAALTPERCFGPLLDCLALSRAPPSPAPGRP